MTYRVEVTDRALRAIEEQIAYIAVKRELPHTASRVLGAIDEAIASLAEFPHRCPKAAEDRFVDYTVRVRIVKRSFLLLYRVDDDRQVVTVVGFRHGRQQTLRLPDESNDQ